MGLETLNGALLIQPQGKANGITAALNAIRIERKHANRVLFESLCTNIARSHALNILYSKYLMVITKLCEGLHRSSFHFVCIFICNEFLASTGDEREP